ncbi:uncharacterized protein EV420DRAFT_1485893 [Desarmillaria tabescens]|uniref:Uncharacterized protein n=1 Tax=Armillaria tabescens TaxID=1929756 RepID=A0AA39JE18_ARMTA|nr:uncharacterized protein EV420DRAFT_1485893 [Desarmillaria tabescens]KAK0440684.1 hypothetical protein EV420DRAFT_1485893 [Desarmillaria tabescens]
MSLVELVPDLDAEAEATAEHIFKMLEPQGGWDVDTIRQGHKIIGRLSTKLDEVFANISPGTIPPYDMSVGVGFPTPIFNSPYRRDGLDPVLTTPPPTDSNTYAQQITANFPATPIPEMLGDPSISPVRGIERPSKRPRTEGIIDIELFGTMSRRNKESKTQRKRPARPKTQKGEPPLTVAVLATNINVPGSCSDVHATTEEPDCAQRSQEPPSALAGPSSHQLQIHHPQPVIACSPYRPLKRDYAFYGSAN